MRILPIAYLIVVLALTGCKSMDADCLVLNPRSQVYEAAHGGKKVPVRLNSGALVDAERVDTFWYELAVRGNRYPFSLRKEPAVLLKPSDWMVAARFDSIHLAITSNDHERVFTHASAIRSMYPQADLYSNLAFLEGYAFEQLGLNPEAKKSYTRFLTYSSQTYSALQRGYKDADPEDSIYLEQRNAARQFVNGNRALHTFQFPPIPPTFPIIPNQPGFLSGSADKPFLAGLSLGKDYREYLSLGIHLSRSLSAKSRFVIQAEVSRNRTTGLLGLPVQLYRSANNRFGLKLSPFLTYSYRYDTNPSADLVSPQRSFVNGGMQVSAGYFLLPTVSLGGVYLYQLRDQPYQTAETGSQMQTSHNVYDLSLYWGLLDNLALKAGVKNKDIVLGCFLSGWEISWSLNKQRLILNSHLF